MPIFFKESVNHIEVDVDGSPRAYASREDLEYMAMDKWSSAGANDNHTGRLSQNVVVYQNGEPYVQKEGWYSGMYLSKTSYRRKWRKDNIDDDTDLDAYLDPEIYPYFVLPGEGAKNKYGMLLGDIAYVENTDTNKWSFAVFGDVAEKNSLTEGSLKLLQNLGFGGTDAKGGGLASSHLVERIIYKKTKGGKVIPRTIRTYTKSGKINYILFPQSGFGNYHPFTLLEMDMIGHMKMAAYIVQYPDEPQTIYGKNLHSKVHNALNHITSWKSPF